jgi:phosphoribosyl 1,2-cyclic phosphodiesterase
VTLRFASLGSGSRGNALLVESDDTLLMIDCGLALKAAEERFRALERSPREVTALLVTHEHADHIQGVARFARRYGTAVWMTPGTAAASGTKTLSHIHTFNCHRNFQIGGIEVRPFPVPHDAREPAQFVFNGGGRRLGVLTDTGHITSHISQCLTGCDALALEFNHDLGALLGGSYPESVKRRIASQLGHLNNDQAADLLDAVGHEELQWVVALHLSEMNNSPQRVRDSVSEKLEGSGQALHIAEQHAARGWLEVA